MTLQTSPMVNVTTRGAEFDVDDKGTTYASPAYRVDRPALEVIIHATFGNVTLAQAS
ncbi:MAG: hypothetical protein HC915_05530 [Anaerolineae bacterium]|nr:hypothetical protein [Anaerolineae bacterium]